MAANTDPVTIALVVSKKEFEDSMNAITRSMYKDVARLEKMLNQQVGKGFTTAGQAAEKGMRQANMAATNLTYQLNDISSSLMGGASPFMVMAQQGSQVAQVMQGLSNQGLSMGSALVSAVGQVFNPISLLSFAFIGLAGYAYQYFTTVEKGSDDAEKAIKKQEADLDAVLNKWGELLPTLQAVRDKQKEIADEANLKTQTDIAIAKNYEPIKGTLEDLLPVVGQVTKDLLELNTEASDTAADKLADQWASVNRKLKEGTANTEDLRQLMRALAAAGPFADSSMRANIDATIEAVAKMTGTTASAFFASERLRKEQEDATRANKALLDVTDEMNKTLGVEHDKVGDLVKSYDKYIEAIKGLPNYKQLATAATKRLIDAEADLDRQARVATNSKRKTDNDLYVDSLNDLYKIASKLPDVYDEIAAAKEKGQQVAIDKGERDDIEAMAKAAKEAKDNEEALKQAKKDAAEAIKEEEKRQRDFNKALEEMDKVGRPALTEMQKLAESFAKAMANAKDSSQQMTGVFSAVSNTVRIGWQNMTVASTAYQKQVEGWLETTAKFEAGSSPRLKAYKDFFESSHKFAGFRVGFGSDTWTDENWQKHAVTADTTITETQARMDLIRRGIEQINNQIIPAIGADMWNKLNDAQKKAILSLSYNYTNNFPKKVAEAIRSGDMGQAAREMENLAGGVNANRRRAEAAQFASGVDASGDPLAIEKSTQALKENNEELRIRLEAEHALSSGTDAYVQAQQTKLKYEELMLEARRKASEEGASGREVTPEEIARIKELADEYGKLKGMEAAHDAALKTMKENQDAYNQSLEDQKKALQNMTSQLESMTSGAISGFINDLRHGVSAGEAFSKMMDNVIGQLIDMAVQALIVKPIFDALRASFPGFTGGAASAKTGGTVGAMGNAKYAANAGMFAGAPRYARGGMVGYDPGAIPIIAHKGEIVIPTKALQKAGTQTRDIGQTTIDARSNVNVKVENGGGTSATTSSSVAFGQLVDRTVQGIIVRESRPGGLLRQRQGAR